VALYDRVRDLPLVVEGYALEGHEYAVREDFIRKTTVIRLLGAGDEGLGEDVTYDGGLQDAQQARGATLPLHGEWTIDSFSRHLEAAVLFPEAPDRHEFLDYRRWAFESAALDLALRQSRTTLSAALGRELRPLNFVVSLRLGDPPTIAPLRKRLDLYPTLRFKLDPVSAWTDELIAELVETGAVDSVDMKGLYRGTVVDQPPDPDLYRRVVDAFPNAWIEDPALEPEIDELLEPHRDRITWDANIHSVADIEGLPFPPRMVNIKPSRLGSLQELFGAYDYCAERSIGAYGGGQFELGPGRGQIQYLASLFHSDAPNDVAPGGYNLVPTPPGLPGSPLAPAPADIGLGWLQA